jgi:hypothetical protein
MNELMEGWTHVDAGVLSVWMHPKHGTYASGLFRLHDEQGFSLTDSLVACRERNWKPCVSQFKADALLAGWSREKIEQVVTAATNDAASVSVA